MILDPGNKDVYSPSSVLRGDFLTFCEPRGLTLDGDGKKSQARYFAVLLERVCPQLRASSKQLTLPYRGKSLSANFRIGIQTVGDADSPGECLACFTHIYMV